MPLLVEIMNQYGKLLNTAITFKYCHNYSKAAWHFSHPDYQIGIGTLGRQYETVSLPKNSRLLFKMLLLLPQIEA